MGARVGRVRTAAYSFPAIAHLPLHMLGYLRDLYRRHRRRFVVALVVVGAVYLAQRYVRHRLLEFQRRLTEENFAREQIRRRFEQTQRDAYYTILSLMPVLLAPVFEAMPVENITRALQARRGGTLSVGQLPLQLLEGLGDVYASKLKAELWQELKVQLVTRLFTLMYTVLGVFLVTRLQLNILARRLYLELAIQGATHQPVTHSDDEELYYAEQGYLLFSWWLLHRGWDDIHRVVHETVQEVFGHVTPRSEMLVEELALLFVRVTELVELNHRGRVVGMLFPTNPETELYTLRNTQPELVHALHDPDSTLRVLLDETSRYVQLEPLALVYDRLVALCVDTLVGNIRANVGGDDHTQFKLAGLLAQVTRQAGEVVKVDSVNDYLSRMDAIPEVDELSAGVYANFGEVA